jgi:hypothetical protein
MYPFDARACEKVYLGGGTLVLAGLYNTCYPSGDLCTAHGMQAPSSPATAPSTGVGAGAGAGLGAGRAAPDGTLVRG